MPELHEPLTAGTSSMLRRAVLDLRAGERRRVFGAVVHLGQPGGPQTSYAAPAGDALDQAVRTDVVAAMLRTVDRPHGPPLVWVTRAGELELHDLDAAWLAAAGQAFAEVGDSLTMVVVTRQGWWDPRSGARRVWKRLRAR